MHFDLAHALVSGALIFVTMIAMQKAGLWVPHKDGGPRWSWPLFGAIALVIFILNIIWPSA